MPERTFSRPEVFCQIDRGFEIENFSLILNERGVKMERAMISWLFIG